MGNLFIKNFPDDLLAQLEEIASRANKSKKEVVIEALQLYIAGKSAASQDPSDPEIEEITEPRLVILRYAAKCVKCGRRVEAGSEAYIAKVKYADGRTRWLVYHPECFIADSQLAKLYVKRRQLQRLINALKKEADRLADAISEAETRKRIIDIAQEVESKANQLMELLDGLEPIVKEYVFEKDKREEALKRLTELKEHVRRVEDDLKRLAERLEEIAAAMSISVPRRRKREVIAP